MPLDDLRTLIDRHTRLGTGGVEGLTLSRYEATIEPSHSLVEPTFVLVARGSKILCLGDRTYGYGTGDYLVVTVDLPVTGSCLGATVDEPFLGMGLRLRPPVIAELLLDHAAALGDVHASSGRTTPGLAVSAAPGDLVEAVVRLVGLLDRPRDQAALTPLIEREILWHLLAGEQGTMIRQIGLTDSALSHIGAAIRWIRDHYADPIRVEELAALTAMSVSTFHRHFRAVTAMTPIQFQKHIRLQQARMRLLRGDEQVDRIGFSIGYDSPSQFSREYRRQYGLPPGQDAARLREAAAA